MTDVSVGPATRDDADAVVRLLRGGDLPVEGVLDHLTTAVVARLDGRVVGCAALEVYDDGMLLRSVAVAEELRGAGIGQRVTREALALAGRLGAPAVFLLTSTAAGFFPRFGFVEVSRSQVPPGVLESVEFRTLCPASATVMRRAPAEPVRPPRRA
jgi:amino-acid N-acetyltransferase